MVSFQDEYVCVCVLTFCAFSSVQSFSSVCVLTVIAFVHAQDERFYDHSMMMFHGFKELGEFGQKHLINNLMGANLLSELLEWSKARSLQAFT